MCDGKFRVKTRKHGRWLTGDVCRDGKVLDFDESGSADYAFVYEPQWRAVFEALADEYEIVPEPPPFVFPPTPWSKGWAEVPLDANGKMVLNQFGRPESIPAIWAEINRRVNWHGTAEQALRAIADMRGGDSAYAAVATAGIALDQLREPTP